MDRTQLAIRTALWMMLVDIPIVLVPLFLYLRTSNYHFLLITLPTALVVNTAILYARRRTLLRK